MLEQKLECLVGPAAATRPLHAVRPDGLAALPGRPAAGAGAISAAARIRRRGSGVAVPAGRRTAWPARCLGSATTARPLAFGNLAFRLPEGVPWRLQPGDYDPGAATLGFCLGAYRYSALKPAKAQPGAAALLRAGQERSPIGGRRHLDGARPRSTRRPTCSARSNWRISRSRWRSDMARQPTSSRDDALDAAYPTVAAVGRGSARPAARRHHSAGPAARAHADAPLISLCGKGVCFDTGGYDLKPSAGMLRMKKDMGGAATVLGLARMIMEADLPVRLAVRVGCVENSRLRHRDAPARRDPHAQRDLTVEVGNTDAEGRLVLCDLLAEASDERPALLVDCATLTGAARVALGPDLPALFCNDDGWAEALLRNGQAQHDPLWRLPLWAALRSVAGQSDRRSQQCLVEASRRSDRGGTVPATFCYAWGCMGAYRPVCVERPDAAWPSGRWRGAWRCVRFSPAWRNGWST